MVARDLAALFAAGAVAVALGPVQGGAQDISVRSHVSRNPVEVGRPFDLNVEIVGAQGMESDPVLPDMDFARLVSTGRTSSVRIVNGVTAVSTVLVYRFVATEPGTFEIGPIYVGVGGQTLSTERISLGVTSSGQGAPSQPGGGSGGGGTSAQPSTPVEDVVDEDDIFLTADVSDRTVFVGEPVVVEYRIWTRVNVSQYSITELPANTGFWVEEFPLPSPEVEQVTRDGEPFATAVIRKVALFPTGPGTRTIEPLGLEAQVRLRRRSDGVLDDFFNRSLLGRVEALMVRSDPVEVDVEPLPPGAPRDFGGFVGTVEVSASLDRERIATNEALSLEVQVRAEGNVQTLPAPDIAFPAEFEVYPPEVNERIDRTGSRVRGTRTYQYILIPRAPGAHTIPPIAVAYFDPVERAYRETTSAPLTVEVTGAVAGDALTVRPRAGIEPLRQDIRFISIELPTFRRTGGTLFGSGAFWAVLLLPLMALAGVTAVRRHQDRLAGDVAWARGRRASRMAHKRLAGARRLLHGEGRAFYAEVGRALQGFLADKLNLPEAGLMRDDVRARLARRGVSDESARAYLGCLEECDRQRFAPSETTTEARSAFLVAAEDAMARVNREVGR